MTTSTTHSVDESQQQSEAPSRRALRAPYLRGISSRLSKIAHTRWLQRVGLAAVTVLLLCAIAFVWAWNATPSTAGLPAWVRAQDTAYHAPYTPLAQISPLVQRALIATEDERFYQHHGIDTFGLLRAAWDDLRAGSFVEGGSTLTAQLAKNAYLHGYDHTISLKAEDLLLALKIEQRYNKGQIMEMYLNLVYFGEGAHGIGAASERYFGVPPSHLDLAESALLAGLVQAPGAYDPWCNPAAARIRQQTVLARMLADNYITPAQARSALTEIFFFWQPGVAPRPDRYCPS